MKSYRKNELKVDENKYHRQEYEIQSFLYHVKQRQAIPSGITESCKEPRKEDSNTI